MLRKNVCIGAVMVLLVGALSSIALAGVTMQVTPASAPNVYGSPSFAGWASNSLYALENGLSSYGNPLLPTYYSAAPATISVADNLVTGFPSWHSQADPGTVFGLPFASELGNRLHFGLHILGNGAKFSVSELSIVMDSDDSWNSLDWSWSVGTYGYSAFRVGINYGPDGVKGTADDVRITSGLNTQLVDELVAVGSGNAWAAYDADPGATRQDKINNALHDIGGPMNFTGTYTLGSVSASGSVYLTAVPLPAAGWAGLALLGTVAAWKRARQA